MARQSATVLIASSTATAPTPVASHADGHKFDNQHGDVKVILENGTGSSVNVTFVTTATYDGLAVADKVVAVPAGTTRVLGALSAKTYNQPSGTDRHAVYVDFGTVDPLITATYIR